MNGSHTASGGWEGPGTGLKTACEGPGTGPTAACNDTVQTAVLHWLARRTAVVSPTIAYCCTKHAYITPSFILHRADCVRRTPADCRHNDSHYRGCTLWFGQNDVDFNVVLTRRIITTTIKIIGLKGAIPEFFQSPHCATNCRQLVRVSVQIMCNTSSACHMQHAVLRTTWYEETAQLLSLTDFQSHLI